MQTLLAVMAGGALGAGSRYLVGRGMGVLSLHFPWGTLTVNVIGSLIIGLLAGFFAHKWSVGGATSAFLTVGFLGGFTTFSAFAMESVLMIERGDFVPAFLYMTGSVILSVAAVFAGLYLARVLA